MARRARRIGDVAKAAGVGVETVRFYERQGLVAQPPKPERGWREYDKTQLRQLGYIRLARELGLTVSDVKRVRDCASGPRPAFCATVRQTVEARLADIDAQLAALQAKQAALTAWLGQCRARGKSADCPLYTQVHPLSSGKRPKER